MPLHLPPIRRWGGKEAVQEQGKEKKLNYMSEAELMRVGGIMNFLNRRMDHSTDGVTVEITCFDRNGEPLGNIQFGEGGEYVFYPPAEES